MNTARKRVADVATAVIHANPTGVRWAELFKEVRLVLPDENKNTIVGALHHFRTHLPAGIVHPDRGVYAVEGAVPPAPVVQAKPSKLSEADFYQPFADWLVGDLEEATKAEPIGGSAAGGKWGTPDVIGLYEAKPSDPVKFPTEVVAAEIKIDTHSLIVAFGQACAYKLFAHRVYIVVPSTSQANDLKRLDALASVVGIGLAKFNPDDVENPNFQVMVRAAKHEPDFYYTNEVLGHFKKQLGL
jgi:hypothetical protein